MKEELGFRSLVTDADELSKRNGKTVGPAAIIQLNGH